MAEQIQMCDLVKYKQKLFDATNPLKTIGLIKFSIQKSKGASNPQNLEFWKDCIKKKSNTSLYI